jgi:hypothetical protein
MFYSVTVLLINYESGRQMPIQWEKIDYEQAKKL